MMAGPGGGVVLGITEFHIDLERYLVSVRCDCPLGSVGAFSMCLLTANYQVHGRCAVCWPGEQQSSQMS